MTFSCTECNRVSCKARARASQVAEDLPTVRDVGKLCKRVPDLILMVDTRPAIHIVRVHGLEAAESHSELHSSAKSKDGEHALLASEGTCSQCGTSHCHFIPVEGEQAEELNDPCDEGSGQERPECLADSGWKPHRSTTPANNPSRSY